MPKKIEDVVVPEKRKSIRDIPLPEGRRRAASSLSARFPQKRPTTTGEATVEETESTTITYDNLAGVASRRSTRKVLWSSVGAGVVVFLFAVFSLFDGGTVSYTPKNAALAFDGDIYTANKSGTASLLYSVVKLSGEAGQSVTASGEQDVSRKAGGTVMLYNAADDKPIKLAENTRIETADGKIYKIQGVVTLPAKKTANGEVVPGSVEAKVLADVAGDQYNIGLSDFVVTGFKSNPAYATKVYARSKTAMTGGFVGKEKVVNPAELATAKVALEEKIKGDLIAQAKAQVPEDFILFPNLSSITYEEMPQTGGDQGSAMVNERGNFYGVMFKKSDLSKFLASEKTVVAQGESIDIEGLGDLNLAFHGAAPTDLLKSETISFEVTGNAIALWQTDEASLKQDLIGKGKKDLATILSHYPSVASASSVLRPFWKRSFPGDASEITLKELPVK